MPFMFVTCDRESALSALRKLYPSTEVTDTEGDARKILDWVQSDVFRIPDPDMHGTTVEVLPGKNWDENNRQEIVDELTRFHFAHQFGITAPT